MKNYPLILLAAGNSSRMGTPKGLLPFENKTLLEFQIDSFTHAGGTNIILVLGHTAREYQNKLPWIEKDHSIKILINTTPELGQFSSIQLACREVISDPTIAGAFILPIDVPVVSACIWRDLLNSIGNKKVCLPTYQGKGGHPVLLSRQFVKDLISIPSDSPNARLDGQIHDLAPNEVMKLEIDDQSILKNINTPADLK